MFAAGFSLLLHTNKDWIRFKIQYQPLNTECSKKKRSPPCLSPSPSPMWQRCNTSVAIGSISASQLSPTPLAPITWSWSQSNRGIGLRARNTLRYWHWEGTPWPQHCALVLVSLVSTQPPVQLPTVIASHRMKVNGQINGHHFNLQQKKYFLQRWLHQGNT